VLHSVSVLEGSTVGAPKKKFVGRIWHPEDVLSMKRTLYKPEHEAMRKEFRQYMQQKLIPSYGKWESSGMPDMDIMREMVDKGFYLKLGIPKEYGGLGLGKDFRYNAILTEELEYADCGSCNLPLGNDVVLPYFTKCSTKEQQAYCQ
jgi:acyl-CoA dehydrogenase